MPTFQSRRWKLLGLSAAIILVSASVIYVYWRIHVPSSPILWVTATSPPLELRMELDKTEFQPNETITVNLFLKNIGSETVEIIFHHIWGYDVRHVLNFIIKDTNGTIVYRHFGMMRLALYPIVLGRGEQRTEILEWNQTLKPGTYKIMGQSMTYSIVGRNLPKGHRLETPLMTVTITPPPQVTATYPPLELSMNLSKTAYQQNETIAVSLFLTNKGSEPVTLSFGYQTDVVGFIVKDENDTEVYVHPHVYLPLTCDVVLESGEQITYTTEWDQKGNLSGKYYDKLVPLGTYKIIGRTEHFGFLGKPAPESGRIETPPITITIG